MSVLGWWCVGGGFDCVCGLVFWLSLCGFCLVCGGWLRVFVVLLGVGGW